ncbi:MAG: hypothetical protein ACREGL_08265 [Alphaproteobacteria bacterium]
MKTLLQRLREPSSYAAIAAVLAMIGVNIDEGLWRDAVMAATGLAGILGVMLREKGLAA